MWGLGPRLSAEASLPRQPKAGQNVGLGLERRERRECYEWPMSLMNRLTEIGQVRTACASLLRFALSLLASSSSTSSVGFYSEAESKSSQAATSKADVCRSLARR